MLVVAEKAFAKSANGQIVLVATALTILLVSLKP
jgi:hypothetical protein